MNDILMKFDRASELVGYMEERGWSVEEIAGTIDLLHSEFSSYASGFTFALPTFETTEK